MYSVKIPRVGYVHAETTEALGDAAWDAVHGNNPQREFYGASQIGARWPVYKGTAQVGTLRYNGRFDAQQ